MIFSSALLLVPLTSSLRLSQKTTPDCKVIDSLESKVKYVPSEDGQCIVEYKGVKFSLSAEDMKSVEAINAKAKDALCLSKDPRKFNFKSGNKLRAVAYMLPENTSVGCKLTLYIQKSDYSVISLTVPYDSLVYLDDNLSGISLPKTWGAAPRAEQVDLNWCHHRNRFTLNRNGESINVQSIIDVRVTPFEFGDLLKKNCLVREVTSEGVAETPFWISILVPHTKYVTMRNVLVIDPIHGGEYPDDKDDWPWWKPEDLQVAQPTIKEGELVRDRDFEELGKLASRDSPLRISQVNTEELIAQLHKRDKSVCEIMTAVKNNDLRFDGFGRDASRNYASGNNVVLVKGGDLCQIRIPVWGKPANTEVLMRPPTEDFPNNPAEFSRKTLEMFYWAETCANARGCRVSRDRLEYQHIGGEVSAIYKGEKFDLDERYVEYMDSRVFDKRPSVGKHDFQGFNDQTSS